MRSAGYALKSMMIVIDSYLAVHVLCMSQDLIHSHVPGLSSAQCIAFPRIGPARDSTIEQSKGRLIIQLSSFLRVQFKY